MNQEKLMNILLEPCVSEKSTQVADKYNQFVFRVDSNAKKEDIKNAVELMFSVKVESVQVSNVKGKRKTFKQLRGARDSWKKAYVRLKEGFDIDFMGA